MPLRIGQSSRRPGVASNRSDAEGQVSVSGGLGPVNSRNQKPPSRASESKSPVPSKSEKQTGPGNHRMVPRPASSSAEGGRVSDTPVADGEGDSARPGDVSEGDKNGTGVKPNEAKPQVTTPGKATTKATTTPKSAKKGSLPVPSGGAAPSRPAERGGIAQYFACKPSPRRSARVKKTKGGGTKPSGSSSSKQKGTKNASAHVASTPPTANGDERHVASTPSTGKGDEAGPKDGVRRKLDVDMVSTPMKATDKASRRKKRTVKKTAATAASKPANGVGDETADKLAEKATDEAAIKNRSEDPDKVADDGAEKDGNDLVMDDTVTVTDNARNKAAEKDDDDAAEEAVDGAVQKPSPKPVRESAENDTVENDAGDSRCFMTPEQGPPYEKKRKATYGTFVSAIKKRKAEASGSESKATPKTTRKSGSEKTVKRESDAPTPKDCDDEMRLVPVGNMKPMDKYLFVMREYVPHVEVAFNELSAIRATAIAYLSEFEAVCDNNDMSVRGFVEMFDKILFVRLPEELKDKWVTDEGRRASQLRKMVMRSCLVMARENVFHDFVPRDSGDLKNADLVFDEDGNPVHPLWLTMTEKDRKTPRSSKGKKKVKKEHEVRYSINSNTIATVVARNEKRKKPKEAFMERKKIVNRGYPKRPDMGYYALNYLYHQLLKIFTKTRRSAKLMFFTMLGYLFMDWTEHDDCDVKDSAVHLRWAASLGESILNTLDADAIKETGTFKDRSASSATGNVKTYHEFGRSVDDVVLLVSHDVIVREDKHDSSQRRRAGCDRRVWKKAINLMDVVVRVLELLCGYNSTHPELDILRAHEYSVPVLYTLARGLRRVISLLPGRVIQDGPTDMDDDDGNDDDDQRNGVGGAKEEGDVEDGDGGAEDGVDVEDKEEEGSGPGDGGKQKGDGSRRQDNDTNNGDHDASNAEHASDAAGGLGGVLPAVSASGETERVGDGGQDGECGQAIEGQGVASGDGGGDDGGADGQQGTSGHGDDDGQQGASDHGDDDDAEHQLEVDLAERFMALFMTEEIANSFHLKQVTSTVEDRMFWAEQICIANENTARFVDITIGSRDIIDESDSESEQGSVGDASVGDACSDGDCEQEPDSDDDFGFWTRD